MDPLHLRKLRFGVNERQLTPKADQQSADLNAGAQRAGNNKDAQGTQSALAKENVQVDTPNNQSTNLKTQSEQLMKDLRNEMLTPQKQFKMNYLASMERANYVKKVMNLPRTLPELLIQLQNPELAKDVHNVLMQPIPKPDSEKADKTNPDSKNKNQQEYNRQNPDSKQQDGFQDVMQKENDRKQAVLQHYNRNEVVNKEVTRVNTEGNNALPQQQSQVASNNAPQTQVQPQPLAQPQGINEGVNEGVNIVNNNVPQQQQVANNVQQPVPQVVNEDVPQQIQPQQPQVQTQGVNEGVNNVVQPQSQVQQPIPQAVNENIPQQVQSQQPQVQPQGVNEGVNVANNVVQSQQQAQPQQPVSQVVNENVPQQTQTQPQSQVQPQQPIPQVVYDTVAQVQPQHLQVQPQQPVPQAVNGNVPQQTQPQPQVQPQQPIPQVVYDTVAQVQPQQPQVQPQQPVPPQPQPVPPQPQPVPPQPQPVPPQPQPVPPQPQPVPPQPHPVPPQPQPVPPQPQPVPPQPQPVPPQPQPQPVPPQPQPVPPQPHPVPRHIPEPGHQDFRPIEYRVDPEINQRIFDARVAMNAKPVIDSGILPDNKMPIIPDPSRHLHHRHRPAPEPPEMMPKPPETKQAEAAANLYANLSMNDIQNPTLTQMRQRLSDDAIELLFTGLINLNELSDKLKHNGHDARSKLIVAMANASKHGIDNSQLAGTMKLVSESMATQDNNPASILKNIITLYLPWYPLQAGVGFNLSIETMPNSSDFSSLLKVYIQTRNYGNVNGSLVLLSGNAVDMNIQCNDAFPKSDLLERMKEVTQNHSIQSNITVEERAQVANEMNNQEANVNLSSTYELNPFLLLMAHSFIKNTIIIDSGATNV